MGLSGWIGSDPLYVSVFRCGFRDGVVELFDDAVEEACKLLCGKASLFSKLPELLVAAGSFPERAQCGSDSSAGGGGEDGLGFGVEVGVERIGDDTNGQESHSKVTADLCYGEASGIDGQRMVSLSEVVFVLAGRDRFVDDDESSGMDACGKLFWQVEGERDVLSVGVADGIGHDDVSGFQFRLQCCGEPARDDVVWCVCLDESLCGSSCLCETRSRFDQCHSGIVVTAASKGELAAGVLFRSQAASQEGVNFDIQGGDESDIGMSHIVISRVGHVAGWLRFVVHPVVSASKASITSSSRSTAAWV